MPDEAKLTELANKMFGSLTASEPNGTHDGVAAEGAEEVGRTLRMMAVGAQQPGRQNGQGPALSSPAVPEMALKQVGHPAQFGMPPVSSAAAITSTPDFYFIREQADELSAQTIPREATAFEAAAVRPDFPILTERVNGRPLVWLDNAATTQKPQAVLDRLARYYSHENSNVHRGAHALATKATEAYEAARKTVADFLGANSAADVVFTRGTTEAINLVAQAWGPDHIGAGDEIVLSHLEHHANIVPWQQLADRVGARLKVIPVHDDGQLDLSAYTAMLSSRTRLVGIAHVSNVVGTIVDVKEIAAAAHSAGARVLVDGAQAVAHMPVNLTELDVDFYAFSGHKVYGPTGIGALFAKPEIWSDLSPWQGGGNMIKDVTFERTIYELPPKRFEAGTGSIADAVGLGAALEYVSRLGMPAIADYEHQLLQYATEQMQTVPGLRPIGTAADKASVLTFVLAGYTSDQVSSALDSCGIAVRSGHHCALPILRRYGLEAAVRPSIAMYNTPSEVDLLVETLRRLAAGGSHG